MEPVVISFSRLQAYQRCPWLFHLVFNESWRSGPSGRAALGQSLHRALASFHDPGNTDKSLQRLLEFFDEAWVNEGFASAQEVYQTYEEGRQMMEKHWALEQAHPSEVTATEKTFAFDWKGIRVQGSIDRLDRDPNGDVVVIEYKTRGDHWTPERVARDHQMTFYQWGVEMGLGVKPIRLMYAFLSTGQRVATQRTQSDIDALSTLVEAVAEKIRAQQFQPDHAYCARCEFGRRCVNFKET